jgi:hypothetical protein
VQIIFSRHARRRARLYRIPESTVLSILKDIELSQGEHEIVKEVKGLKYPLKIVVRIENDILTVITNYPLKKGRKNEGILR